MKYFLHTLAIVLFVFISCQREIPEENIFDNPLDEDVVEYDIPALTLFPSQVSANVNSNFKVDVFVLGVDQLAGSYVRLNYDKTMLQVALVEMGTLFADAVQEPIFVYEDNSQNGWIDIHTSFLGSDSVSVSGTGSMAEIIFTSLLAGESTLTFDAVCELVDPDDNPIEIKGFGDGVVNAN